MASDASKPHSNGTAAEILVAAIEAIDKHGIHNVIVIFNDKYGNKAGMISNVPDLDKRIGMLEVAKHLMIESEAFD